MFEHKGISIPHIIIPWGVVSLLLIIWNSVVGTLLAFLFTSIVVAGKDIFQGNIDGALNRISASLFAIFYQPFLYSIVYYTTKLDHGNVLLVSLIIIIWSTDTFAYFLGMLLGKHRGVFKVSPKKSIEGFLFGIVFAFIAAYLLYLYHGTELALTPFLIAALSAGVFGQFGDLLESLLKRDAGIKDSSTIIPGHGGILDRFDSFLITVPVFYLLYYLYEWIVL